MQHDLQEAVISLDGYRINVTPQLVSKTESVLAALSALLRHTKRHESGPSCGRSAGRALPSRGNERTHLEAVLELRLKVSRLVERRLRGSEGRPLVAVQKRPRADRARGRCLARWWRLTVQCCGRGEDSATEFRIRYCRG